jgi:hypothetical protein
MGILLCVVPDQTSAMGHLQTFSMPRILTSDRQELRAKQTLNEAFYEIVVLNDSSRQQQSFKTW